jgi:hypothetical protein
MPYTIKYKPTETTVGEFYSIAKTLESYAGRLDTVKNNVGTFSGLGNFKSGIASRSISVYNVAKAVVVYGEALDEARISYLIAEQKAYQLLSGDTSFNVGDGVRAVTAPTIGGSSTSWWDKMIGGIRDAISGIIAVGIGAVSAIGGTITSWFDKLKDLWDRAFSPKPVTVPAPEPAPTPAPQTESKPDQVIQPEPVNEVEGEQPPVEPANPGASGTNSPPNLNSDYYTRDDYGATRMFKAGSEYCSSKTEDKINCVYYACARASEVNGLSEYAHKGTGSEIRANSIARFTGGLYGRHDVYIENVIYDANGSPVEVIISDSNITSRPDGTITTMPYNDFLHYVGSTVAEYTYF